MYGPLPFKLDFFTECMNLAPLLRFEYMLMCNNVLCCSVHLPVQFVWWHTVEHNINVVFNPCIV